MAGGDNHVRKQEWFYVAVAVAVDLWVAGIMIITEYVLKEALIDCHRKRIQECT